MSKSRSTTPTNTNRPPSSQSTSIPTTSRPQIHEIPPTGQPLPAGEREEQTTVIRPTPTHSSSTPVPQPSSTEHRPHPTESLSAPMAKRLRTEPPPQRLKPVSRSSPSSDSQGGMADTEDGTRSQHSERSPPPVAAPKKKRTRTLTTPHQSAVLHALLAQSRFPTTAMREEVGRSIGLSARKVQIWFQNQRQKARRPRTTDDTSSSPQYGPFPQSSFQQPVVSRPDSLDEGRSYGPGLSGYPSDTSFYSTGSMESPSRLLGPGMPGPETRGPAIPFSRRVSPPQSPVAGPSRPIYGAPHSNSPPRRSRPTTSTVSDVIDRDSRTLPPLVFTPQPSMGMIPPAQRSAPTSIAPFMYPSHRATESSSAGIPPPFTLQPPPQWDNSHFTTVPSSAHSSSWSRPDSQSAHEGSVSPTSPPRFTHATHEELERDDTLESSRRGRYDPVRASLRQPHSSSGPSSSRTDRDQRPPL